MRVKNKPQDLHRAAKALRRAVAKCLKLRRNGSPEFELTHVRRRCFIRFECNGSPRKLSALETRGFEVVECEAFDQPVVKAVKSFQHGGYTYTAKVTVYPEMKRCTMSVQVALHSFS